MAGGFQHREVSRTTLETVLEEPREDGSTSISDPTPSEGSPIHLVEPLYDEEGTSLSERWTRLILATHTPLLAALKAVAGLSARNPRRTIFASFFVALSLITVGVFTNFQLNVNMNRLWTPPSLTLRISQWRSENYANFIATPKTFVLFFHNDGENILQRSVVAEMFTLLDSIRDLPSYHALCDNLEPSFKRDCRLSGITKFWGDNSTTFQQQILSDNDLARAISVIAYPDGEPVIVDNIMGYGTTGNDLILDSVQSFSVALFLPNEDNPKIWAEEALQLVFASRKRLADHGLKVEVQAHFSIASEFLRAIADDLPLIPLVFIIMSIFTALVFSKQNRVSRALLGLSAVVAVMLSLLSGYGLMFCIGIPTTSITNLAPFIIMGVGLDDAFIVFNSFERTDPNKSIEERIGDTIDDIGLSITLTTITSATAFFLGCMSSVPAVFWLCLYSGPSIVFVFCFQLTFFVACIVLDEKRVLNGKRDCLFCLKAQELEEVDEKKPCEAFVDRIMTYYADLLLHPFIKVIVMAAFLILFVLCVLSALQMKQHFEVNDILPRDSYVKDFAVATREYRDSGPLDVGVYFQNVDHSDPAVRAQMKGFINDLVERSDHITHPPQYDWLGHFDTFLLWSPWLQNATFNDQMDAFLGSEVFGRVHYYNIGRDPVTGNVTGSRAFVTVDVDLSDVQDQLHAFSQLRQIADSQPINQESGDIPNFFTYDGLYRTWEFFAIAEDELILSAIVGVCAVTAVAFVFIPHWSAAVLVFPMICLLYVDLLGVMQWAGVTINAVSYVCLAMSIGLMVDFVMHILFRYYESPGNRREKTVSLLRTMGSSILLGGTTTFIGILPLMFSTSDIFETVFYTFLGNVTLGMGHGLILLPVLLSTFGPEESIDMGATRVSSRTYTEDSIETSPPSTRFAM